MTGNPSAVSTPPISVLVTDLDNTLFDWLGLWNAAFSARLEVAERASQATKSEVLAAIKKIHQRHGTSEYAFLLNELHHHLPAMPQPISTADLAAAEAEVKRRSSPLLTLYDGVSQTFGELRSRGVLIIGYTESMAVYTARRLISMGLDGMLDAVYSPRGHDVPDNLGVQEGALYAEGWTALQRTAHHHTPVGKLKPDPDVLRSILQDIQAKPTEVLYVGDSVMKDIALAQHVGTHDALADYGSTRNRPEYELLKAVTHWSQADVEREQSILSKPAVASNILRRSISEILDIFSFERKASVVPC